MNFHFRKTLLSTIGIFLTTFYGFITIICIMIIGLDIKLSDFSFETEGIWRFIPEMQILAIVLILLSFIIGMFIYTWYINSKTFQFIYSFILIISTLVSFIVSIIILVGATINKNNLSDVCRKDYNGLFKNFNYLDEFFYAVDQVLCSDYCECPIMSNYSAVESFTSNPDYSDDWEEMVFTETKGDNFNFANCEDTARMIVINELVENYPEQNLISSLKSLNKFGKFWGKVEKKFDCTGWCKINYVDDSKINRHVIKHLFYNINKGVASNKGCMKQFTSWIVNTLVTFGCTLITISILQLFNLLIGLMLLFNCHKDGFNYEIPDSKKNNNNNQNRIIKIPSQNEFKASLINKQKNKPKKKPLNRPKKQKVEIEREERISEMQDFNSSNNLSEL